MKLLLADPSRSCLTELVQYFEAQGYIVESTDDGQTALQLAEAFKYDLILLNKFLPNIHGLVLCKKLRGTSANGVGINQRTPIIIISNHSDSDHIDQKIRALDLGADDYLVKPLALNELMAKIRVLMRWSGSCRSPLLEWQGLSLNSINCTVKFQQQQLPLCRKEYDLLQLFLRNPQRLFTQDALIDSLWRLEDIPTESTVRTHIKKLRRKLKEAGAEDMIETVYGLGYRLKQFPKTSDQAVANDTQDLPETRQKSVAYSSRSNPAISFSRVDLTPTVAKVTSIAEGRPNDLNRIYTYFGFIQKFNQLKKTALEHNAPLSFVSLTIKDFADFEHLYGEKLKKQVLTRVGKLLQYVFRNDDLIGHHEEGGFVLGLYGIPTEYVEKRISNFLELVQHFPFSTTNGRILRVDLIAEVCNPTQDEVMPPPPRYGT
jgi:DNA-binding response OmpR family regulator/GGDEF domain-containing protein